MAGKEVLIEVNVGGKIFTTKRSTLTEGFSSSRLAHMVRSFVEEDKGGEEGKKIVTDSDGRLFIDRDPAVFAHILQYLREVSDSTQLPTVDEESVELATEVKCKWFRHLNAADRQRFEDECEFFQIPLPEHPHISRPHFTRCVSDNEIYREGARNKSIRRVAAGPKYITIGYRATYEVSRDAYTNDKFRRITRITVCGNAAAAKEVFDDDINDSRDPDRQPSGGYTSRYYLKHNHLEKAFEALATKGFQLMTSISSGSKTLSAQTDEYKIWTAYLDYVFYRP